jgi:uncharacterized protein
MSHWLDTPHILSTRVHHKRVAPRVHALNYRVWYLAFPAQAPERLKNWMMGVNIFRPFSYFHRDHGARDGTDAHAWARDILQRFQLADHATCLTLITMPRVLGYVFNPVSFWLASNAQKELVAVIAEVNNTFGETHSYVLAHEQGAIMQANEWFTANKQFHVSPFLKVEGTYRFRFALGDNGVGIWIDHHAPDGSLLLNTSMLCRAGPYSAAALCRAFFIHPLLTLKVIGLIHYHALRLTLKRIRYLRKPTYSEHKVTLWHS